MSQIRLSLRPLRQSCRSLSLPYVRAYSVTAGRQAAVSANEVASSHDFFPESVPSKDRTGSSIRKYVPRTPGIRHLRRPINDHLWKGRPLKELTFPKKGHGKGGRNSSGRVTVRHHGGGHKRRIRMVDFKRFAPGPHIVERIEHDPGRSGHIALVTSQLTRQKNYVLAVEGLRAGDIIESYRSGIPEDLWTSMGRTIDPGVLASRTARRGNCLPLHMVPVGTTICNVGLHPQKGGQLCRSAGTYAVLTSKQTELPEDFKQLEALAQAAKPAKSVQDADAEVTAETSGKTPTTATEATTMASMEEGPKARENAEARAVTEEDIRNMKKMANHVTIRLQSGEVRLIHKNCCATIGVVSNPEYQYTQIGKAGRSRWLNIRPTVRGVAMNAMDHPHGGGRGKSKGNVHPKSPWGWPVCFVIMFFAFLRIDLMNRPNLVSVPAPSGASIKRSLFPVIATKESVAGATIKWRRIHFEASELCCYTLFKLTVPYSQCNIVYYYLKYSITFSKPPSQTSQSVVQFQYGSYILAWLYDPLSD